MNTGMLGLRLDPPTPLDHKEQIRVHRPGAERGPSARGSRSTQGFAAAVPPGCWRRCQADREDPRSSRDSPTDRVSTGLAATSSTALAREVEAP